MAVIFCRSCPRIERPGLRLVAEPTVSHSPDGSLRVPKHRGPPRGQGLPRARTPHDGSSRARFGDLARRLPSVAPVTKPGPSGPKRVPIARCGRPSPGGSSVQNDAARDLQSFSWHAALGSSRVDHKSPATPGTITPPGVDMRRPSCLRARTMELPRWDGHLRIAPSGAEGVRHVNEEQAEVHAGVQGRGRHRSPHPPPRPPAREARPQGHPRPRRLRTRRAYGPSRAPPGVVAPRHASGHTRVILVSEQRFRRTGLQPRCAVAPTAVGPRDRRLGARTHHGPSAGPRPARKRHIALPTPPNPASRPTSPSR
jgi:hypothetical protein